MGRWGSMVILCVAGASLGFAQGAPPDATQDGTPGEDEAPKPAPQDGPRETLEARVIAVTPNVNLEIDRGRRDRLQVDDPVLLRPREGPAVQGRITRVEARTAIVELTDPRASVAVGTRAEIRIPVARRAAPPAPRTVPVPGTTDPAGTDPAVGDPGRTNPVADPADRDVPEHPPWEEDDWLPDMPLLSEVGVGRPERRPRTLRGRVYAFGDYVGSSNGGRDDTFTRMGTDLEWTNPFGRGGRLQVDGEFNLSRIDAFEQPDRRDQEIRIDRLSYAWGGNRFDPRRYEVGRFLQYGMPEFGIVDGAEYTQRRDDGSRFGASIGRMPEPNSAQDATDDFQVAAWYGWVRDESERTAARIGYQKTFHNGNSDRDLFVLAAHHLPRDGWSTQGTVWIDHYQSRDVDKGRGLELTQAMFHTGRQWKDEGVDVTYRHLRFPQTFRNEFPDPGNQPVFDDHTDRLAVSGWRDVGEFRRARVRVGAWQDQDDAGHDAELGFDHFDLWVEGGSGYSSFYASRGKFSSALGARLGFGRTSSNGRWDLFYDVSQREQKGFEAFNDDLVQHRLRASRSFHTASGWDVSFYAESVFQDQADAYAFGFFVQRSF
ncbi:MAG: hypothetical protein AAF721_24610 [Myxococcota bacterium]